ncbi:MAG: hypothetical protein Tsb0019_30500 [Roseibium sp.]
MPLVEKSAFPGTAEAGRNGRDGLSKKLGFQAVAGAGPSGPLLFTLDLMHVGDLEPAPIRPEWVLEGNPQARCKRLAGLSDYRGDICHWSCTAGRFRWHYGWDEGVMFLEGEVEITDRNGNTYVGKPGVSLFFPAGTVAEWHVPKYIRKIAFNHNPVPRNLHRLTRVMDKAKALLGRLQGKGQQPPGLLGGE